MKKEKNVASLIIIFFVLISLAYFALQIKRPASSKEVMHKEISQRQGKNVKQLLEVKDKETGRPKLVVEWEKATLALLDKEAKVLKAKGMSAQQINAELNRMASERVAKMFGIDNPEIVQQVINEYSLSMSNSKNQAH